MPDFKPQNVSDFNTASKEDLISYLTTHEVSFGETALKPELLSKAREHFMQEASKEKTGTEEPNLISPTETTAEKALDILAKKGFKDKEELIHFLNSLERQAADLRNTKVDIDEKTKLIEQKDIEFAAREEAMKKDSERMVQLNNENDSQLRELQKLRGQ